MNRSQEIIQLFYQLKLPEEITLQILNKERIILFHQSLQDWNYIFNNYKTKKEKELFYKNFRSTLCNEISIIKGDFNELQKYKFQINYIIKHNQQTKNYLSYIKY
tara:strand:- start:384 stop:698 length:315 start_codon:yes stop_codon:yes gene_type:complete